jgi:hypothetical protein
VEKVSGSAETKKRLKVILETLSGERSVEDACATLGVKEAQFHRLREEALAGAAAALEPRPSGRPRHEQDASAAEVAALKAEVLELKVNLRAAEIREELALTMPHVLVSKVAALAKKKGGGGEPQR